MTHLLRTERILHILFSLLLFTVIINSVSHSLLITFKAP